MPKPMPEEPPQAGILKYAGMQLSWALRMRYWNRLSPVDAAYDN